jgi:hypothetical protein
LAVIRPSLKLRLSFLTPEILDFRLLQQKQPTVSAPTSKERIESKSRKEETLRTSRTGPRRHLPQEEEPLCEGRNEKQTERNGDCDPQDKRRMVVTQCSDEQQRGNGKPTCEPE